MAENGQWWGWLWASDEGLLWRIGVGVALLAGLLVVDLIRKGRQSQRLREYAVLLAATAGAMAFGVVNDMVTVTISPEYFLAHEGLSWDWPGDVRLLAAGVALKASWTAGLAVGVAMLLANNPSRRLGRLPTRRLYGRLLYPLAAAAALATACGAAGYLAARSGADSLAGFRCVQLAHLGAYAGAVAGLAAAVVSIRRARRRSTPESGDGG